MADEHPQADKEREPEQICAATMGLPITASAVTIVVVAFALWRLFS